MSIEATHDTPKGQLDAEINEALAGTGEVSPVGYWPAFPDEPKARSRAPRRASRTSPGSSRTKKAAKKGAARKKARSKAKARPLKKKTARKASSRKPRARSTKKRATKKKSSKKSTAKKRKKAATTTNPRDDGSSGGDLLSRVRSAVRHMGAAGRYGSKVFISEIYDKVNPGMSMSEFKRWLVGQNRERTLNLARADLVGAMDPGQVSRSEIVDMGSSFHFVNDPDYRYGWG